MRNGLTLRRTNERALPARGFERLFDDIFLRGFPELRIGKLAFVPSLDVSENDDSVVVKAEVPGVSADDLEITIDDGALVLSGEKKNESEERKEGYYRSERVFGSFRRSITLPESVDPDKVSGSYEDGVLVVTLEKTPAAKPKRVKVALKRK